LIALQFLATIYCHFRRVHAWAPVKFWNCIVPYCQKNRRKLPLPKQCFFHNHAVFLVKRRFAPTFAKTADPKMKMSPAPLPISPYLTLLPQIVARARLTCRNYCKIWRTSDWRRVANWI
jgi:hypothetical protein